MGFWVTAQERPIAIFIDCNCDNRFIRQQLAYVNHVRDQGLADIQLFIYDIKMGSGGRSYTLDFKGKNAFDDNNKKLVYETTPTMTSSEVRQGLLKKIQLGLVGYLMETEMADDIVFIVTPSSANPHEVTTTEDAWANWIFEIYGEGEFKKETSKSKHRLEFGFEGDKITEKWRIRTDIELNRSVDKFENDGETFHSKREEYEFDGSVVRSLCDHWSLGMFTGIQHDSYNNLKLSIAAQPAIEYSIFPYSEVLMREISFAYRIGYLYNEYQEPTIYSLMSESLYGQTLNLKLQFRQDWGNLSANLAASSYLHDFSKNRVKFRSNVSVRVLKGLSVRFSSNLELIRDQISLPAGDASLEDVLLQQRQIATDFKLGFRVGLGYTFGSAYNNIINTRL
ncbi:MAG: hypothetical protein COA50_06870 [Flavobacteriaceae bacterium]|nr:MAG: hypothetical protein COA50_06870 [Flavobacteriaceae bacterium]